MPEFLIIPDFGTVGVPSFLSFDLTETERHRNAQKATDFPVEDGGTITDHLRKDPRLFSFDVYVTETPIKENFTKGRGIRTQAIYNVPFYVPPISFTPGGISRIFSSLFAGQPPTPMVLGPVLQFAPFNAVQEAQADFDALIDSGALCTIVSSTFIYDRMVFLSYDSPRRAEGGATFSCEAKQLRIVESKTVAAPVPREPRGTPATKAGPSTPAPTPPTPGVEGAARTSVLAGIFGGVGGLGF